MGTPWNQNWTHGVSQCCSNWPSPSQWKLLNFCHNRSYHSERASSKRGFGPIGESPVVHGTPSRHVFRMTLRRLCQWRIGKERRSRLRNEQISRVSAISVSAEEHHTVFSWVQIASCSAALITPDVLVAWKNQGLMGWRAIRISNHKTGD